MGCISCRRICRCSRSRWVCSASPPGGSWRRRRRRPSRGPRRTSSTSPCSRSPGGWMTFPVQTWYNSASLWVCKKGNERDCSFQVCQWVSAEGGRRLLFIQEAPVCACARNPSKCPVGRPSCARGDGNAGLICEETLLIVCGPYQRCHLAAQCYTRLAPPASVPSDATLRERKGAKLVPKPAMG